MVLKTGLIVTFRSTSESNTRHLSTQFYVVSFFSFKTKVLHQLIGLMSYLIVDNEITAGGH